MLVEVNIGGFELLLGCQPQMVRDLFKSVVGMSPKPPSVGTKFA